MLFNFLLCVVLLTAVCGAASRGFEVKVSRDDRDRRIETLYMPMKDGVGLHTVVIFPRGYEEGSGKQYPIVMDRSPYGYGDMEWLTDIFLPFGFVAVGQDVRGAGMSFGNYSMWASDGVDSRAAGDYLTSQEWSNGKIYTLGASADGIASLQTTRTDPDWLKAQYIIWATPTLYQTLYPFGTYKQKTAEDWLHGLFMINADFVNVDIDIVRSHEMHSDEFWGLVELSDEDYANVDYPSGFWAGWYDLFQLGTFQAFDSYNTKSAESVRGTSKITVDAAGHCLEAGSYFTGHAVLGRTALPLAQMLEVFGIRPVTRTQIKSVTFYVMSSNDTAGLEVGQYWTSLDTWPEAKMTDFYFHADKSATTEAPVEGETESTSYVHDPANPVPTQGGNNLPDSIGGSIPCGPMDQAETDATHTTDQLLFQTAAFDEELALTGGIYATLFVSSDATDTDFMVKISDVYPTGEVRILQDNAVRMRWREETLDPVYMEKGSVYKVEMNLWNTSYVVAPGHALRIAVASSNFPRFSVNPNNGLLIADEAYPGENITATNVIYHSAQFPSKVTLPVITDKEAQLPMVNVLKEVQKAYPMLTDGMLNAFSKYITAPKKGRSY